MGTRADVLKAIPATNVRMTSTNVPTQISVSMERARYSTYLQLVTFFTMSPYFLEYRGVIHL